MDASLFVVQLFFGVLFLGCILSYLTYLPIPVFSYSQGKEKMYGRVSAIKKLKGGMTIEISLDQKVVIGPRLKDGSIKILSSGVTYLVYFRRWQKLPKIGEAIKVDTENRYYMLRGKSLNWVKSWQSYSGGIPVEITMDLINHHNVQSSSL